MEKKSKGFPQKVAKSAGPKSNSQDGDLVTYAPVAEFPDCSVWMMGNLKVPDLSP